MLPQQLLKFHDLFTQAVDATILLLPSEFKSCYTWVSFSLVRLGLPFAWGWPASLLAERLRASVKGRFPPRSWLVRCSTKKSEAEACLLELLASVSSQNHGFQLEHIYMFLQISGDPIKANPSCCQDTWIRRLLLLWLTLEAFMLSAACSCFSVEIFQSWRGNDHPLSPIPCPPNKNKKTGRAVPNHAVHLGSIHRATETGENSKLPHLVTMPRNFLAQHGPSPPLGHLKYRCNAQMILVWQIGVSETATDLARRSLLPHVSEASLPSSDWKVFRESPLKQHGFGRSSLRQEQGVRFHDVLGFFHLRWTRRSWHGCKYGIWISNWIYESSTGGTTHAGADAILFSSPASHDSPAKLVWRPSQYFAATAWGNRQLNMKFDMIQYQKISNLQWNYEKLAKFVSNQMGFLCPNKECWEALQCCCCSQLRSLVRQASENLERAKTTCPYHGILTTDFESWISITFIIFGYIWHICLIHIDLFVDFF